MAVAGFMVVAEVMVVAGVIDETRAGESAVSVKGVAYDACNTDWV
jgi:predicted RNase H-like nuclease (RuvC/YqgF family)